MAAPPPEKSEPRQQRPSASAPAAALSPATHQMDADDEDENVKQLNECSAVYLALQDCLVRTDRDWRSCQSEVQALKACNARRSNTKK